MTAFSTFPPTPYNATIHVNPKTGKTLVDPSNGGGMASRFVVGQPLFGKVEPMAEMPEYTYSNRYHLLFIPFSNPSPVEVVSFQTGAAQFGVTMLHDLIFFQCRFGAGIPLQDCVYSWHNVSEDMKTIPDALTGQERVGLSCFLVDADTSIVKAIRFVSLSPVFSQKLVGFIRQQTQGAKLTREQFETRGMTVFNSMTTNMLFATAQVNGAVCYGGE